MLYEKIDLPPFMSNSLFLAYSIQVGSTSGSVHKPINSLFYEHKDPEVIYKMNQIANLPNDLMLCLSSRDEEEEEEKSDDELRRRIGELMDLNFDLRCEIYGKESIGISNLNMIQYLRKSNCFSAKFCGSGGAIICLRLNQEFVEDDDSWLEEMKLESFKRGYEFVKLL